MVLRPELHKWIERLKRGEKISALELPRVVIDFETRSIVDVTEVGAWAYAEHESTEILCLAYRLPWEHTTRLWTPLAAFPQELIDLAENGFTFEAHNVQFERAVWYNLLYKKLGIPMPKKWVCTLATCAYRSLPLKLEAVGDVLGLEVQKDSRGKYLLGRLSSPRKPKKKEIKEWEAEHPGEEMPTLWNDDFGLLEELYDYCVTDVNSEAELGSRIGDLTPSEYRIWVLDQTINWRGVMVDLEAVHAAKKIADECTRILTKKLVSLTDGAIETAGQRDKFLDWFASQGASLPDMKAETIEATLKNERFLARFPKQGKEDHPVVQALKLRTMLSRASTKKLDKFIECTCRDGRIRGLLQYHGAGTGRWAGRLVQPQNFPRGNVKAAKTADGLEKLIAAIKLGDWELIEIFYGDVLEAIAAALRGMFIAAPGKEFKVADFSAIEARVTMWLAQQEDAVEAFRRYDRKEGPDIYCFMASRIYNREITKDKDPEERQLGKITILGCGYQMGAPKLQMQAEQDYGIKLPIETCEMLVSSYRESYPMVKQMWTGLENAAIEAIQTGKQVSYSYVAYEVVHDAAGKWLTCILPNGRRLWYYNPRIQMMPAPWDSSRMLPRIVYEGRDNKRGGAWNDVYTYGGMLTENVVQAISRDLMVEGMIRVEKMGHPIVMTVHDEVVAESPIGFGTIKEFEAALCETPPWADGLPIATEGWIMRRYRKA